MTLAIPAITLITLMITTVTLITLMITVVTLRITVITVIALITNRNSAEDGAGVQQTQQC